MSELTPDDLREFMKRLEQWDRFTGGGFADAWQSQLAERDGLIERLKQEAQAHAMEARAHRSTVHECYQAVGAQKGNWNGATPIVDAVAGYKKRIAELELRVRGMSKGSNRRQEDADKVRKNWDKIDWSKKRQPNPASDQDSQQGTDTSHHTR